MKKILLFILIISLIGCETSHKEQKINREERAEIIFEAIKNKDIDTVKNFYSPYVKEHVDLDADLENLMNYLDEIQSYDNIIPNITSDSDTRKNTSELITGVIDSSGKKYTIHIDSCIYRKNYPECEGVFTVKIVNDNTSEFIEAGIKEPLPQ